MRGFNTGTGQDEGVLTPAAQLEEALAGKIPFERADGSGTSIDVAIFIMLIEEWARTGGGIIPLEKMHDDVVTDTELQTEINTINDTYRQLLQRVVDVENLPLGQSIQVEYSPDGTDATATTTLDENTSKYIRHRIGSSGTWSPWRKFVGDDAFVNFEFSQDVEPPEWREEPANEDVYMRMSTDGGNSWKIFRFPGRDGRDGKGIEREYSINGIDNWHRFETITDNFERSRVGNVDPFGPPRRIRGFSAGTGSGGSSSGTSSGWTADSAFPAEPSNNDLHLFTSDVASGLSGYYDPDGSTPRTSAVIGDVASYLAESTRWIFKVNIRGIAGTDGTIGSHGERGSKWSLGIAFPNSPIDGDMHLFDDIVASGLSSYVGSDGSTAKDSAEIGDIAFYDGDNSQWQFSINIRGLQGVAGTQGIRGPGWSSGNAFPESPIGNDLHLFTQAVTSGLTGYVDPSNTDKTSADIGDFAQYDIGNTRWVFLGSLLGPKGEPGTASARGSKWTSGNDFPAGPIDNDLHLFNEIVSNGLSNYVDSDGSTAKIDASIGDVAFYDNDNSQWQFLVNIRGLTGEQGIRGSSWSTGNTFPSNPINNDLHLFNEDVSSGLTGYVDSVGTDKTDALNGDFAKYDLDNTQWVFIGNITGPQGLPGTAAARGSKWTSGNTFPASPIDNDLHLFSEDVASGLSNYVDSDGSTAKDSSSIGDVAFYDNDNSQWQLLINIRGQQGIDGSQGVRGPGWTIGNDFPASPIDDDLHLFNEDVASGLDNYFLPGGGGSVKISAVNGDIAQYNLDDTRWEFIGNIAGPKGLAGAAAARGSKWTSGNTFPASPIDNDLHLFTEVISSGLSSYVDSDGSTAKDSAEISDVAFYDLANTRWQFLINIKGADGEPGEDGIRGSRWTSGNAFPVSSTEDPIINNDLHLFTETVADGLTGYIDSDGSTPKADANIGDVAFYDEDNTRWQLLVNIRGQIGVSGDLIQRAESVIFGEVTGVSANTESDVSVILGTPLALEYGEGTLSIVSLASTTSFIVRQAGIYPIEWLGTIDIASGGDGSVLPTLSIFNSDGVRAAYIEGRYDEDPGVDNKTINGNSYLIVDEDNSTFTLKVSNPITGGNSFDVDQGHKLTLYQIGIKGEQGIRGTNWSIGNTFPANPINDDLLLFSTDVASGLTNYYEIDGQTARTSTILGDVAVYNDVSDRWIYNGNIRGPSGGVDGDSFRVIFMRSATPITRIGIISSGGTWNGATYVPPAGWSTDIPDGDDPLYVSIVTLLNSTNRRQAQHRHPFRMSGIDGESGNKWSTGSTFPVSPEDNDLHLFTEAVESGLTGYVDSDDSAKDSAEIGDVAFYDEDNSRWKFSLNIVGNEGQRGSIWSVGDAFPTDPINSDLHLFNEAVTSGLTGYVDSEGDPKTDAINGDIARYNLDNTRWEFIGNLTGPQGLPGTAAARGSKWTSGITFPASPIDNDLHLFTEDVSSGLANYVDDDGSTAKADANIGDVAFYDNDNSQWQFLVNIRGSMGIQGDQGVRGSSWSVGNDFPASPIDNDFHLFNEDVASGLSDFVDTVGTDKTDASNGDIAKYNLASTRWEFQGSILGPQGPTAAQGIRGTRWTTGNSFPASPLGNDLHLFTEDVADGLSSYVDGSGSTSKDNALIGDVAFYDAGNTRWQFLVRLTGSKGERGNEWSSGSAFPVAPINGDLHLFTEAVADGLTGYVDSGGSPDKTSAVVGDVARYDFSNTRWEFVVNIKGVDGTGGTQGERGSAWTVGNAFPASPQNGDFHLFNADIDGTITSYYNANGSTPRDSAIIGDVAIYDIDQWEFRINIRGLQGEGASMATIDIASLTATDPTVSDEVILADASDSGNQKKTTLAKIIELVEPNEAANIDIFPNYIVQPAYTGKFSIVLNNVNTDLIPDTAYIRIRLGASTVERFAWDEDTGSRVIDFTISDTEVASLPQKTANPQPNFIEGSVVFENSAGDEIRSARYTLRVASEGYDGIVSVGNSFPSSAIHGDLFLFNEDVASGLNWYTSNGTTSKTDASAGDLAQYRGVDNRWVLRLNIRGVEDVNKWTNGSSFPERPINGDFHLFDEDASSLTDYVDGDGSAKTESILGDVARYDATEARWEFVVNIRGAEGRIDIFAPRAERVYFNSIDSISSTEQTATIRSTSPIDVTHGTGNPDILALGDNNTTLRVLRRGIYIAHLDGMMDIATGGGGTLRVLPRVRLFHGEMEVAEIDDHYHLTSSTYAADRNINGYSVVQIPSDNYDLSIRIANDVRLLGTNFDIEANWSITFIPLGIEGERGSLWTTGNAFPASPENGDLHLFDADVNSGLTGYVDSDGSTSKADAVIGDIARYDQSNTQWQFLTNIRGGIGPQGVRGSKWSVGNNFPAGPIDDDLHLFNEDVASGLSDFVDSDDSAKDSAVNGDIAQYDLSETRWEFIGNIAGPQGIQGIQGVRGSTWSTGAAFPASPTDTDIHLFTVAVANGLSNYIDADGSTTKTSAEIGDIAFYDAGNTRWQFLTNIRGATGEQGTPGERGSKWTSGSAFPDDAVLGDMHLFNIGVIGLSDYVNADTSARTASTIGDIATYDSSNRRWQFVSNIRGTDGATWTIGNSFPTGTLLNGQLHLFNADVNSGLTSYFDADGSTARTSAILGDIAVYNLANTRWEYSSNIRGPIGPRGAKVTTGGPFPSSPINGDTHIFSALTGGKPGTGAALSNYYRTSSGGNNAAVTIALKGDVAEYNGTSWFYQYNITPDATDWSIGNAFPTEDLVDGQLHLFDAEVASGLSDFYESDGTTARTRAELGDVCRYDAENSRWIFRVNIGLGTIGERYQRAEQLIFTAKDNVSDTPIDMTISAAPSVIMGTGNAEMLSAAANATSFRSLQSDIVLVKWDGVIDLVGSNTLRASPTLLFKNASDDSTLGIIQAQYHRESGTDAEDRSVSAIGIFYMPGTNTELEVSVYNGLDDNSFDVEEGHRVSFYRLGYRGLEGTKWTRGTVFPAEANNYDLHLFTADVSSGLTSYVDSDGSTAKSSSNLGDVAFYDKINSRWQFSVNIRGAIGPRGAKISSGVDLPTDAIDGDIFLFSDPQGDAGLDNRYYTRGDSLATDILRTTAAKGELAQFSATNSRWYFTNQLLVKGDRGANWTVGHVDDLRTITGHEPGDLHLIDTDSTIDNSVYVLVYDSDETTPRSSANVGDVFVYDAGDYWVYQNSLIGPRGTGWSTGNAFPASPDNNDLHLFNAVVTSGLTDYVDSGGSPAKTDAAIGDIAKYDEDNSRWEFLFNTRGAIGPQGVIGPRGNIWNVGNAFPASPANGDLHLFNAAVANGLTDYVDSDGSTAKTNAAVGDFARYDLDNTEWVFQGSIIGPQGIAGTAAARGSGWTSGTSFPSSPINNDLHLFTEAVSSGLTNYVTGGGGELTSTAEGDIARYDLSSTRWVLIGNIAGSDGLNGSGWSVGNTLNTSGLEDGHIHLFNADVASGLTPYFDADLATLRTSAVIGDIATLTGGVFVFAGNIRGPIGETGTRGSLWSVGSTFPSSPNNNDLHMFNSEVLSGLTGYTDTAGTARVGASIGDVAIYDEGDSRWEFIVNIRGPQGATPPQSPGEAGEDGTAWHVGAGFPPNPDDIPGARPINDRDLTLFTADATGLENYVESDNSTPKTTSALGDVARWDATLSQWQFLFNLRGMRGLQGDAGVRGNVWSRGGAFPVNAIGGDLHLFSVDISSGLTNYVDADRSTAKTDAAIGDVAFYDGDNTRWQFSVNIVGATGGQGIQGVRGSLWTVGSAFASSPNNGDLHLFDADVSSGLTNYVDADRSTAKTNSVVGDVARYDGDNSRWQFEFNAKGIDGTRGSLWNVGSAFPASPNNGDLHLFDSDVNNGLTSYVDSGGSAKTDSVVGDVARYDADNTQWVFEFNIKGPDGSSGVRGSLWTIGNNFPASPFKGDFHLFNSDVASGLSDFVDDSANTKTDASLGDIAVYDLNNTRWQYWGNIRGARGQDGDDGTSVIRNFVTGETSNAGGLVLFGGNLYYTRSTDDGNQGNPNLAANTNFTLVITADNILGNIPNDRLLADPTPGRAGAISVVSDTGNTYQLRHHENVGRGNFISVRSVVAGGTAQPVPQQLGMVADDEGFFAFSDARFHDLITEGPAIIYITTDNVGSLDVHHVIKEITTGDMIAVGTGTDFEVQRWNGTDWDVVVIGTAATDNTDDNTFNSNVIGVRRVLQGGTATPNVTQLGLANNDEGFFAFADASFHAQVVSGPAIIPISTGGPGEITFGPVAKEVVAGDLIAVGEGTDYFVQRWNGNAWVTAINKFDLPVAWAWEGRVSPYTPGSATSIPAADDTDRVIYDNLNNILWFNDENDVQSDTVHAISFVAEPSYYLAFYGRFITNSTRLSVSSNQTTASNGDICQFDGARWIYRGNFTSFSNISTVGTVTVGTNRPGSPSDNDIHIYNGDSGANGLGDIEQRVSGGWVYRGNLIDLNSVDYLGRVTAQSGALPHINDGVVNEFRIFTGSASGLVAYLHSIGHQFPRWDFGPYIGGTALPFGNGSVESSRGSLMLVIAYEQNNRGSVALRYPVSNTAFRNITNPSSEYFYALPATDAFPLDDEIEFLMVLKRDLVDVYLRYRSRSGTDVHRRVMTDVDVSDWNVATRGNLNGFMSLHRWARHGVYSAAVGNPVVIGNQFNMFV